MLFLLLSACAAPAPEQRLDLARVDYRELPGWAEDATAEALRAFLRSCGAIGKMEPEQAAARRETCRAARAVPPGDDRAAREFFARHFVPFAASAGGKRDGLLTGYFEPLLYGSRVKEGRYRFPIYRLPPDLTPGAPYFTREEIDRGALAGRGLELLWVDDDIALFFLHIQGSGQVELADGSRVRVGFAGKNNRPYVAIGKVLMERGALKKQDISMQSIAHWLWNHPYYAKDVLWRNPSYVFFREIAGDGPVGTQGAPLTAGRSLAVDARFIPLGAPVFIDTVLPGEERAPLRRLTIAQDTGGAIKGPLRGDVFFGFGPEAARLAGSMKHPGSFTLLLPRAAARGTVHDY